MNSFSTVFVPNNWPAIAASLHGTPTSQASGASVKPSRRCNVGGAPATFGSSASAELTSVTSAMSTISKATMFKSSVSPSTVPRVIASMLLAALISAANRPAVGLPSAGTRRTKPSALCR